MLGYWTIFDPNKELVQRGAWPFLIRWGFSQAIYKLTHKIIQTGFPLLYLPETGRNFWKLYGAFAPSNPFYNRTFSSVLSNGIYIAEVVINGQVYQEKFVVI